MSPGVNIQYLNGLGFTAANKRRIHSGKAYDGLFPAPKQTDPILKKDGSVQDTVDYCKKIVASTLNDTKAIANILAKRENGKINVGLTSKAIFDFIYNHIQYEIDKPNVEQVRRPARTWADRKGDCDCMAIFASSILTNLGIHHAFRIVKMYGRNYFQHIYVVVPTHPGSSQYYTIDPVLDQFDTEAPKINFKQDFPMNGIDIQYLNGTGNRNINIPRYGSEFEDFDKLKGTADELSNAWHRRMKQHLINAHAAITEDPRRVSSIYNAHALAGAYKELINSWDSEHAREGALDRLSNAEESLLHPQLQGLGDILFGDDDRLFGMINSDLIAEVSGFDGFGKAKKGSRPASKKAAARKAAKAAKHPVKKRGVFTKVKNASKAVKSAAKKGASAVKKVGRKAGHAVVKGSATPIRAGMLLAMKTNFGRLASRMYWGLFSQAEAVQHGIRADYWQAANTAWTHTLKIFVDKLKGSESALRKSILTGRAAKVAKRGTHGLGSIGELYTDGFTGLGVVTEASITAASAVLAPLLVFVNKLFKGRKPTDSAPADDGNSSGDDTDSPEQSQSASDNAEDNYNNEVVENQPTQEPEADGSVQSDDEDQNISGFGETECVEGFGDLGKKIKSKPGTITHKRVKHDKIKRAKSKKSAGSNMAKPHKKLNLFQARSKKAALKSAHAANAHANKKLTKHQLIAKLKKNPKLAKMTPQQLSDYATSLQNKTPQQIALEAETFANNAVVDNGDGTHTDTTSNSGGGSNNNPVNNNTSPADAGNSPEDKTDKPAASDKNGNDKTSPDDSDFKKPTGDKDDNGLDIYPDQPDDKVPTFKVGDGKGHWERPTIKGFGADVQAGWVWIPDQPKKEGWSTGAKVFTGLLSVGAIALIAKSAAKEKPKKKSETVHGLGGTKSVKKNPAKPKRPEEKIVVAIAKKVRTIKIK